jgi:hypothetical protein
MPEIRRSCCGLCHPRCGTLLHMEDGRFTKVTGDPDHRVNRGVICERGRLMPDHLYHPDGNAIQRFRRFTAFSNPTSTRCTRMAPSSAAPKSEAGPLPPCCAGLRN